MDAPTLIWLVFVLKMPIVAALLLIWYAVSEPKPAVDEDSDGGGSDRHERGGPRHPRPPRRGPHATPPPASPRRMRAARGRRLTRQH